jgi:peptide/nickel transport system substrate-binding protein
MKATMVLVLVLSFLFAAGGPGRTEAPHDDHKPSLVDHPPLFGGRIAIALRSEPKSLNPVIANDISSREVIGQMTADLIHINRHTQLPESCLVKSWKVSSNGLRYELKLRNDVHFSDGVRFDADDVIFSFKVYLDHKLNAPQRDTLVVGGTPITVRKSDAFTVTVELAHSYASAERLFDGVAMLPRHLLEQAYDEGKLARAWTVNTSPVQIAGLGPFRLKDYVPGQHMILERNPYYWKTDLRGSHLPYLSELAFVFVGNEEAQMLRFEAGDVDIVDRIGADDYLTLQQNRAHGSLTLYDLGPGLDYNFLLLNLNSRLPARAAEVRRKQLWFNDPRFRQALSSAIDREAMNRIVYHGRGVPIWTHVSPGNRLWFDSSAPRPAHSLSHSEDLLKAAGFSRRAGDGALIDTLGAAVEFSVIASTSSNERIAMATMLQQDLRALGIRVQIVPLEFHSLLDRVFQTHDYEAVVMGLGGSDVDPNSQMSVWLSSGDDHLWNPNEAYPATDWEAEIDHLMRQQMSTLSLAERKHLYDRVQEIETIEVPVVFLVSPDLLVGAKDRLSNFDPTIFDSHTLWNSEQLFLQDRQQATQR